MTTNYTLKHVSVLSVTPDYIGMDDISRMTSIPRTTARNIVSDLLNKGCLEKKDLLMNKRGRRNVFYKMTGKGNKILCALISNAPDVVVGNVYEWTCPCAD